VIAAPGKEYKNPKKRGRTNLEKVKRMNFISVGIAQKYQGQGYKILSLWQFD